MHVGPFGEWVTSLTWLNLLLSLLVVLYFSGNADAKIIGYYSGVFAIGMFVEMVGVNTGFPFGEYHYPELLGIQCLGVPLIIGANWLLLALTTRAVALQFLSSPGWRVVAAAAGMVGLDVLLEPFAVRHGLWIWTEGLLPGWENYAAWFLVGLLIQWGAEQMNLREPQQPVRAYGAILLVFLLADVVFHG